MASKTFPGTDDDRTEASGVRNAYRKLTSDERRKVDRVKAHGAAFIAFIDEIGTGREASLARTKVEEAVIWAVKGITS